MMIKIYFARFIQLKGRCSVKNKHMIVENKMMDNKEVSKSSDM